MHNEKTLQRFIELRSQGWMAIWKPALDKVYGPEPNRPIRLPPCLGSRRHGRNKPWTANLHS